MLKVKLVERVGVSPIVVEGRSVVVTDSYHNPLVVVLQLEENCQTVLTINDGEQFHKALALIGMDRTVINERIALDPPPAGSRLVTDLRQLARLS